MSESSLTRTARLALIITPSTPSCRQWPQVGLPWRGRSPSSRWRRQGHLVDKLLEQRRMGTSEETFGSRGAVRTADVKVVHGGEGGELAVAEAVTAVVKQRKLPVATFDSGTTALEQIRAFRGHLLNASTRGRGKLLERMLALAQRRE